MFPMKNMFATDFFSCVFPTGLSQRQDSSNINLLITKFSLDQVNIHKYMSHL